MATTCEKTAFATLDQRNYTLHKILPLVIKQAQNYHSVAVFIVEFIAGQTILHANKIVRVKKGIDSAMAIYYILMYIRAKTAVFS